MDMYEVVIKNPILAILRNIPVEKTLDYCDACVSGGVGFFEVALNSPYALKQIRMMRDHFGDNCMIGAGTAITVDKCKAAMDAGAQFLLTPGTPLDVYEYCAREDLMLLPGVLSPSEVATSLEYGYKTMKLFPGTAMPMNYIKDLKGPFDQTNYMVIGGVSPDNIHAFFDAGAISVGLASSLMPKSAVAVNDWQSCVDYIKNLVAKARG
jgi:2-dehydro-3-deoxyphosphogluconate aldolase/(4S)-4-hydroxy-2-oxoglutarate aldolase